MKSLYITFIFGCIVTNTFCDVLTSYGTCEDSDPDTCTIHEVRVTPCAEASRGKPCKLKKAQTAHIEFDYTPNFSAQHLSQRAYSASFIDLPLIGMESDGCKATKCPLESDTKSTYSFDLLLASAFPSGSYNVKWRLWDTENEEKECCFIFKIKLVN